MFIPLFVSFLMFSSLENSFGFSYPIMNAATSTNRLVIVWFRNDLRISDNPVLSYAATMLASTGIASSSRKSQPAVPPLSQSSGNVLCLYCFDPRQFALSQFGSRKTGSYRAQFLLESVENLRNNLRSIGSDLLVSMDKPEDIIPKLAATQTTCDVVVHGEVTWEESQTEIKVEKALKICSTRLYRVNSGCSLYHPDDIPFRSDLQDIPNTFTVFKDKVEKRCSVRSLLPTASLHRWPKPTAASLSGILGETCNFNFLPSLAHLGFTEKDVEMATTQLDSRGVMRFMGGEDAAKNRISEWMFRDDRLKEYFEIRNGMLGEGYSSKLSPWLAAGCISPRSIFHEVKRYEQEKHISNKSTYWLIFELIWRDFFRYLCAKYGNNIFFEGGAIGKSVTWKQDKDLVERWKLGFTGIPLVDANMRELLRTGWMSNRGRQNVASYLVLDLGIDWRIGADHFESLLLDHDVCSNYGNWNAAAGLTGGRVNKFNITKQSKDYDANGDYIRHWIPELKNVPAPMIFEPWKLSTADQNRYGVKIGIDYPSPLKPFIPKNVETECPLGNSVVGESRDTSPKSIMQQPANAGRNTFTSAGFQRKFSRVQHL